ncbi:hypothetical protein K438DRAFT_1799156 [Mycena galopus ATCC 62051]|nr:hypothetical protein K438DRAFT_1799156 [Mycena galopus ATCC 62051]
MSRRRVVIIHPSPPAFPESRRGVLQVSIRLLARRLSLTPHTIPPTPNTPGPFPVAGAPLPPDAPLPTKHHCLTNALYKLDDDGEVSGEMGAFAPGDPGAGDEPVCGEPVSGLAGNGVEYASLPKPPSFVGVQSSLSLSPCSSPSPSPSPLSSCLKSSSIPSITGNSPPAPSGLVGGVSLSSSAPAVNVELATLLVLALLARLARPASVSRRASSSSSESWSSCARAGVGAAAAVDTEEAAAAVVVVVAHGQYSPTPPVLCVPGAGFSASTFASFSTTPSSDFGASPLLSTDANALVTADTGVSPGSDIALPPGAA